MDINSNTCVTCLCNNRKLVPLNELGSVLQYIHFTELKLWNGGICWECKIIIMKFYKFKRKALQVQHLLINKVQNLKPLTNLGTKVNVPYNYHYNYEDPPICEKDSKIEIHIKEEINNSDNEQSEIENSDSDLDIYDIKTEIELTETDYIKPTNSLIENVDNKIIISTVKDSNRKFIEINPLPCSSNSGMEEQFLEDTATKYLTKEDTAKEYSDKFIKVIRSEKEMLKDREDKRNHPNYKNMLIMPFKCDFCVLGFMTKDSYDEHMENSHDESIGPYACHVCDVRFESMLDLGAHRKIHYVYYKCRFCKYTTSQQGAVLNHCKMQHEKEGEGSLFCQQCKAVLSNHRDLEEHMKIRHTIHCKLCGLKFINHYALKKHRSQSHERYICDLCKQSFITKSRLETHMTKHSALMEKKMSYCSECKVQFKSLACYRAHVKNSLNHAEITESSKASTTEVQTITSRKKTNAQKCRDYRDRKKLQNAIVQNTDTPDKCSTDQLQAKKPKTNAERRKKHYVAQKLKRQQCKKIPKTVKQKNKEYYERKKKLLALNTLNQHSDAFSCSDCNRVFSCKEYRKKHYNFIHLRKSKHYCELCDKLFMSAFQLRNHNQVHHGMSRSRDHTCNECGKKFFTANILRNHQQIHSENRSFMCDNCGDTFKQQAALYTHTKLVHEGRKKKSKKLRDS